VVELLDAFEVDGVEVVFWVAGTGVSGRREVKNTVIDMT
jgi:hypothetical protein